MRSRGGDEWRHGRRAVVRARRGEAKQIVLQGWEEPEDGAGTRGIESCRCCHDGEYVSQEED